MRRQIILSSCVVVVLALIGALFAWNKPKLVDQKQRDDQWAKVNDAINKGLPQTAIKEIEPIIQSALQEKAYPEAIKAIAKKIAYEGMIQGNKPEERITRMKAEIAKAPDEMKPVMEAILAQWYWHYFIQNRWRFMQRTATATAPSEDFTTWDLPRLFKEIDNQFTRALSYEEKLKKIPIKEFDALIDKGTLPDSYRPTLYDFVAFETLGFYGSGELAAAKAEDAFEIDSGSPIFGNRTAFLQWKPDTTDTDSPKLKAIQLYQKLIQLHADDAERSALLDADIHRLHFAYQHAYGEEKKVLYKKILKQFADENANHELSAQALADLAGVVQSENDLVEARNIAIQGENRFPRSQGGINCHNIIQNIEMPHYQVQLERVWTKPLARLHVDYKNVTKLYFRVYQANWDQLLKQNAYSRPEQIDDQKRQAIMSQKPVAEWSADLPATEDYQQRSEEVAAPENLPAGFYFIVACPDNRFSSQGQPLSLSHFWVSDLALVLRQDQYRGVLEGFVLNSNTGEPISGAKVTPYIRNYQQNRLDTGKELVTDKNGLFQYSGPHNQPVIFYANANGHAISNDNDMYNYGGNPRQHAFEQVVFFTDRALYRPGQTIRFKGIALRGDHDKQSYQTLAQRNITVIFFDPNHKEISKTQVTTNDVGSFSGSFTAPRDRLMGRMMIQSTSPGGAAQINVEEYKRPKFEVTVDAPKDSPKLNDTIKLNGKAIGYSGAAVSGAKLRYRVTRQTRYPSWWGNYYWWRMPHNAGTAQEMAHGTAVTEADGTFTITFAARPDPSVGEKDEPVFMYTASVDVTDTTGETRSGSRALQVGYTALQANVSADDWLTSSEAVKLKISTSTIDGQGLSAKGNIKVYLLKQPEKVLRASFFGRPSPRPVRRVPGKQQPMPAITPTTPDPSDPRTWELGEQISASDFTTSEKGEFEAPVKLGVGIYRAMLETQDRFGKPVKAMLQFQVIDPAANKLALKIPHLFAAPRWKLEPGEEFSAVWGTGYESGKAFVEIEHRQKIVSSYWTSGDRTQNLIKQATTELMRGGFNVRVTFVRENRAYLESRHVDVPWTNKELKVKWEHFVSKLEPGKKETWTAVVTGPDARKAVAEMAAACYDASLDAYLPHHWMQAFSVFYQDYSYWNLQFQNYQFMMHHYFGTFPQNFVNADFRYRTFPADISANIWHYMNMPPGARGMGGAGGRFGAPGAAGMDGAPMAMARNMAADAAEMKNETAALGKKASVQEQLTNNKPPVTTPGQTSSPNLENVTARTNLSETAFFFPHLMTDEQGTVKLEFTMPEALTKWKFMGFAHDKQLKSGYLEDTVVTAKDLMVQPNPPRFLREGDLLEFTVKVSNQSPTRQRGKVRLSFTDSRTAKSIDVELGNKTLDHDFDIPAKESRSFSWKLNVPDGIGPITYKAVGATDKLSDGEEGMLPVLSRRVLVQESLPLPIRGQQTKAFNFKKLLESGKSETIQHQSLTVQMVSNPSWYAVMALPYLMEYPYECSEQTFNRFYANTLARHIALSDPKIRKIFDQWKNTPALDSPLEKNQDLKAVMLEETPWLRQAMGESASRRNVGILFDDNRLQDEMSRAFRKLVELQNATGAWSWFPGGPDNEYITLYITTGFGRLRHLGVKPDMAPAIKSLNRLDAWMDRIYRDILRHPAHKDENHLSSTVALYLYGRSFFVEDQKIADQYKEAFDYWLGQARKYWLQLANRQSQAHLAIALKRWGDRETPQAIMNSIKERSVTEEELGRFWRDTELSFWWYHAPIETQALMIEAFDEVMNDAQAVEDCKVWLLKQKQTQNWKTTKSTADAVYSLLLRGSNLLKSDALVEVSLAGTTIKPEKVEAGTGFYEQKFVRGEIKPEFGKIELKKVDAGVAWGSIHWQYLEDISKVTPHEGTPLKLQKQLFKRTYTKKGPVLEAVQGPVSVGDEIVVRIVLRTDRDMEYVHMKDHRGSGTEPTNVLSRYKYQDGLGYYESTKDTASHFFIDYLPKGTYVFEYAVRVQHQGKYPTGMAHIECMYSPEFNSHSESIMLEAK